MPHIEVDLRMQALKRVIPVFGKKAPPSMKARGVKTKVAVGRNAIAPRLSVLFEIVDLRQDHACTTRKFSARRRQNSLPHRSVEQNNLILRFQLLNCRRNGLWTHMDGASSLAHAAIARYRLKVFELRKLHRLLQRQPRRRAARPQMRFSPRFLPPRTCMWKCITVWPALTPLLEMTRKPSSRPLALATSWMA